MRNVDLQTEWWGSVRRVLPQHTDWMTQQGVPHIHELSGRFGVGRIEAASDGLYQPLEYGREAIIVPSDTVESGDHSEPTDLVAFLIDDPSRYWRRIGRDTLINEGAAHLSSWANKAITVHATPLDWLRADCIGCVVLDPLGVNSSFLADVPEIVADMPMADARRLEDCLKAPVRRIPKVSIPSERIAE
jgi:hypothetical protein